MKESGCTSFWSHSTINDFKRDWVDVGSAFVHLRNKVGVLYDLVVSGRDSCYYPFVGIGNPFDLFRCEFKARQQRKECTPGRCVSGPSACGLRQMYGVIFFVALPLTFENRQQIIPSVFSVFNERRQYLSLKCGTSFNAQKLEHAARSR
ncbi:MAG: hypothetical protein ACP5VS_09275, partial [Desulfomonilaceae bacterium]